MKALVAFGVLVVGLGITSMIAGQVGTTITVERGDMRLTIPSAFVIERRLGGVEHVMGLDSEGGTVLLRVPASEVQAILPPNSSEFPDLIVSLRLLTQQEEFGVEQSKADIAKRIRERSQNFSEARLEKDWGNDWYRLYETPRVTFRSYVLARQDPTADDIIALCTKSPGFQEMCVLPAFVVHDVGVELSLPVEGLKYRGNVREYLTGLIAKWRH